MHVYDLSPHNGRSFIDRDDAEQTMGEILEQYHRL